MTLGATDARCHSPRRVLYLFGSLLVDTPSRLIFIGKYKGQKN
jgi:hypothetical protein